MADGYELLLKAQCEESMGALHFGSERILEILRSESRFDVRTRLFERIAFLVYQDSNFGLLPIDTSFTEVQLCIGRLCKSIVQSGFPTEIETFVGPCTSSDLQGVSNNSRERILCATLLSTTPGELTDVLHYFSNEYPSTSSFSLKLLNNDERFLTTMLIITPLVAVLPTDSIFHPVAVFLEAMNHIDYDCEVLIDWLNSELAASSLLLRILKSNCKEETQHFWRKYEPKKIQKPHSIVDIWKEVPSESSEVSVNLKIIEIVGDTEMSKTLAFSGKYYKKSKIEGTCQNLGSFNRWAQMVVGLKSRLRRLIAANLISGKTNIILKWCDKFVELNQK